MMGDLISRSALLKRLNEYVFDAFNCDGIDGESVLEYQQTHDDNSTYIIQGFNDVYELLEDIPTVDAVPVVRCKDCVHWGNKIKHGSFLDVKQCDFHGTRHENSYCSDGEKVQE